MLYAESRCWPQSPCGVTRSLDVAPTRASSLLVPAKYIIRVYGLIAHIKDPGVALCNMPAPWPCIYKAYNRSIKTF